MSTGFGLHEAVLAYADALQSNDETPSAGSANAVIAARLALYERLLADGWQPPPGVHSEMLQDRVLIQQNLGALGDRDAAVSERS